MVYWHNIFSCRLFFVGNNPILNRDSGHNIYGPKKKRIRVDNSGYCNAYFGCYDGPTGARIKLLKE